MKRYVTGGRSAGILLKRPSWPVLAILFLLLSGCGPDKAGGGAQPAAGAQPSKAHVDPYWVSQGRPRKNVAVVFVHGLFGSVYTTWNNEDGTGFFRFLKEQPDVGDRVDIFAFGFTSNMLSGGSLDIREAATKLDDSLKFNKVWDYDSVVFVAHSMGGLVTLRELVAHPERRAQVPLVVLYATPARGSDIAGIGKLALNNPAVRQLIPADNNELLQQLSDDWGLIPAAARPAVICAYEKSNTFGQMVVPWSSAVAFCNGAPSAIGGANHLDIVKPDRPTHDSMVVLVNALQDHVLGSTERAFLETPDFVEENDAWVLYLKDPNGKTPARLVNNGRQGLRYIVSNISDDSLVVTPDPTPRTIPGQNQESLKIILGRGGELKDEYRFTLWTPILGERLVKVRIGDKQVIRAVQLETAGAVAAKLDAFLSSPDTALWLATANEQQRVDAVIEVVRQGLVEKIPELPADAGWLLTADLLASIGWPDYASRALANVETKNGANARAIARLDDAIAQQSMFSAASGGFIPGTIVGGKAVKTVSTAPFIDSRHVDTWLQLSVKMRGIPALEAEGFALKGDVLRYNGKMGAAIQAYQKAIEIRPAPVLLQKKSELLGADPYEYSPGGKL